MILIVDDNPDIIDILSDICDLNDVDFLTACNGKEALKVFEENEIQLIITDLNMPIMDGAQLISEVRKIDKNVKIAVLSAFVSQFDFSEDNVDYIINKPFQVEVIRKIITDI